MRPFEQGHLRMQFRGVEIGWRRYGLANGASFVGSFKSSLTRFGHYQAFVVAFTQHIFNFTLHVRAKAYATLQLYINPKSYESSTILPNSMPTVDSEPCNLRPQFFWSHAPNHVSPLGNSLATQYPLATRFSTIRLTRSTTHNIATCICCADAPSRRPYGVSSRWTCNPVQCVRFNRWLPVCHVERIGRTD